jgi:hypothetical protein
VWVGILVVDFTVQYSTDTTGGTTSY